jgi:xylulose-5-phosphate/fructose-6-phosphate phosphoketolase
LFTEDKPIIFNFHGYPWLVHRLTYRRTNHKNLHVRGYKEKGNINTPLDLAIQNQIDRFSLAIDVIDRVPALRVAGAHAKEALRNMQIECQNYAYEHGIDKPDPGSVDLARLGQVISAGLPVVFTSGQFMEGWRPVG